MGDLIGCWRRYTMPRTIRKKKSPLRRAVQQVPIPAIPRSDYFPPERDPDREVIRYKLRQRRIQMGEAKDIVGKPHDDHFPLPVGSTPGSVIQRMGAMIDDTDRAIQVKEHDLVVEGSKHYAENHYKLGILKAADSLLRRARALLQDYGTDIEQDFDPTEDIKAASGEDLEQGVVIPLNGKKDEDEEDEN